MRLRLEDPNHPDLAQPSQEDEELAEFIKEDAQFWDYRHEMYLDDNGELIRFKRKPAGKLSVYK
jgi:predicted AAA+ superfamily ATPase